MNWWRMETDQLEAVGLGDGDFNYQVSRKGKLVELTVTEGAGGKIVYYAVWNRKEKEFEGGGEHV